MFLDSLWAWTRKLANQYEYCPPQKGQIQKAQGEHKYAHFFPYKHYSHFNDHFALQALPKIAK